MRTLAWRTGCIAIALAALVSCPGVSFGLDCSYGGAINPPLPDVNPADGFCDAGARVKAQGSLVIPPDSPLEIVGPGLFVSISELPPRFPFSVLPGSFFVDHSVVASVSPSASADININAVGDIRNEGGILSIVNEFDQISLKASVDIVLNGPDLGSPVLLHPSTLLIGAGVTFSSEKGRIEVNNTVIEAFEDGMDMVAPRGSITIHNTIIFVLPARGGEQVGFCRFQPQVRNHVVIKPVVGFSDPTNIFVCTPVIVKK